MDKDDVYFYHFTFTAGTHTHEFGKRFSEYGKIHKQLDPKVDFASSKILFNKEKREEREQRHKDLLQWVMDLLCSSEISHNPLFHELFRFPAPMVEEIKRSVAARRQQLLRETMRPAEALMKDITSRGIGDSRTEVIKENTLDTHSIKDIKV